MKWTLNSDQISILRLNSNQIGFGLQKKYIYIRNWSRDLKSRDNQRHYLSPWS